MNKQSILRILTSVLALLAGIATINPTLFPPKVQPIAMIGLLIVLGLKEIVVVIGDYVDDGKRNNSFGKSAALLLCVGLGCLTFPSCCLTLDENMRPIVTPDQRGIHDALDQINGQISRKVDWVK